MIIEVRGKNKEGGKEGTAGGTNQTREKRAPQTKKRKRAPEKRSPLTYNRRAV